MSDGRELTPWHRLFGLQWMDFFHGLPVEVELEKDLSLKQQFLDIVIVRKEQVVLPKMPDGFDDFAGHNLITFKSYQETLDGWALNELVGHYVNYRKQCSPSMQDLLAETDFRLYAVCVRFPQALSQRVELRLIQHGVYEVRHFTGCIRIVVVQQLPEEPHNSLLHLFSAKVDQARYAALHYQKRSKETTTLLNGLFERYLLEGVIMANKLEEFYHETVAKILKEVSLEERLKGLTLEERIKGISLEECIKGISLEDLLKALPPEKREELARLLKSNDNNPPSKPE